jgi:integrase
MLLAATLSPRARAYVRLALFEALRVSEIARMRGEYLDCGAGWLLIHGDRTT